MPTTQKPKTPIGDKLDEKLGLPKFDTVLKSNIEGKKFNSKNKLNFHKETKREKQERPVKISEKARKHASKLAHGVILILEFLSFLMIIYLILRLIVFSPYVVVGSSMFPTLENGEKVYGNVLAYKWNAPKRGDIIVLVPPKHVESRYVKRIIGLPGEELKIRNDGQVIIINDQFPEGIKLREPYLPESTETLGYTIVSLNEDEYFVMGDNRMNSSDSRNAINSDLDDPLSYWTLPRKNIVAKVVFTLDPWTRLVDPEYNF